MENIGKIRNKPSGRKADISAKATIDLRLRRMS
jgi:hypothetical protein